MDTIEELTPLTAGDIKKLEIKKTEGGHGCLGFSLFVFFLAGFAAYYFYGFEPLWFYIFGAIAVLFLLFLALTLWAGPTEDKNVVLDLKEGNKLRIVAPIESKDIKESQSRGVKVLGLSSEARVMRAASDSYKPLDLKYSMKVRDFTFELTEEQYLTSFRKGEFVEFFAAPHSKTILSAPVIFRE